MKAPIPAGRVLVFDDDHFYLGGALAEHLAKAGAEVTLVTPASEASSWTHYTLEYERIQKRLRELGVTIVCNRGVAAIGDGRADLACVYTGDVERVAADCIVPVIARVSEDGVGRALLSRRDEWADHGVKSVSCIGDSLAPGTIAMAVHAGYRFAGELEAPVYPDAPFRRENDFDERRAWPAFDA